MLKVIQIVPGVIAQASGPAYSVPGIVRGLCSSNVDAIVYALGDYPPWNMGFPLKMFPRTEFEKKLIPLGVCRSFYKGLIDILPKIDVVHTNGLWMLPTVYPEWAIQRIRRGRGNCRAKFVISPRGALASWALRKGWLKKKIFGWLLQNRVLRKADMFHATSEKEYEEIRAAGYKQPVVIVPIGMDLPEVDINAEAQRRRGTERLRKILFFGRLHKVKGVDRLLLAWEKVAKDGWELVIAGPDRGMLGELKGIVAERKLPRVSFVGEINGPAKYEFLAGGDIYVLPSDTENFGVTVTEALVSGTPVIASQGTPWQGLERERCGKWVPIGVEPLAAALKEMMAMSDEERAAMGVRGREWIRRDFSWKGIGAKMKAAYEWLLAPEKVEQPEWVVSD